MAVSRYAEAVNDGRAVHNRRTWIIVGAVLGLFVTVGGCCLGWGEIRWWVAPPSCSEMATRLVGDLDYSLRTEWPASDGAERVAMERVDTASRVARTTSRTELAQVGQMAADLNASPGASSTARRYVRMVRRSGENVVRACE